MALHSCALRAHVCMCCLVIADESCSGDEETAVGARQGRVERRHARGQGGTRGRGGDRSGGDARLGGALIGGTAAVYTHILSRRCCRF